MAMPSTLLYCGLLLLLPVPFVSTDPQSYKMEDNDESDGGAGGNGLGYLSYFFNAPERYRSLPEPSLTRDDTRASWNNLAAMGNRQFDDIRQAITAAWRGGGGLRGNGHLSGGSAMDDEDEERQQEQEQDEDDEAEVDNQQQQRLVDNDYDSRIGQFAQNKRSSLGKRLQFNQDMRQHYIRMFNPNGRGGMSGGGIDGVGGGAKMRELKRERHGGGGGGGGGTTLSVESPMDLIRQRLMQELRRRELVQKQRQIQTNEELLSTIGKRNGRQVTVSQPPPPPPPPPPSSAFNSRLSFAPN